MLKEIIKTSSESMFNSVLIFLGVLIPSILTYHIGLKKIRLQLVKNKKELEEIKARNIQLSAAKSEADIKLSFFNQIIDFTSINIISNAVNRMFSKTKADRFLIMIAVNGKSDFNIISVVFEQHKLENYRINAIARYHNITIDLQYKQLLKETETKEIISLATGKMPESLLKDFYINENVQYSLLRKLVRKPIDKDNDFLVYSSISTHENRDFTRLEKSFIKTQYEGTIIPNLLKVLTNQVK